MFPSLEQLATYLDQTLESERFLAEQSGIYHASSQPIRRIGLTLEPWEGIQHWIQQERLDALFLHRPWRLTPGLLPGHVGVLTYHLAFDAYLTFGFNPRLAQALSMTQPAPFAYKDSIPQGMRGLIKPVLLTTMLARLADIFGEPPHVYQPSVETITHIAVVGAMTDALMREAASNNIDLYITGQFRQPAARAMQETQITVAAIGHAAGEWWGLRALAGLLRERWSQLDVVLAQRALPIENLLECED